MSANGTAIDDEHLADALALPSGASTPLQLQLAGNRLPLTRLDADDSPAHFGYLREPQPDNG